MYSEIGRIFHRLSLRAVGRVRGLRPAPFPPYSHKRYPETNVISLPPFTTMQMPLGEALLARRSGLEYERGEPLTLAEWSTLLGTAFKIQAKEDSRGVVWPHRPYPSGGARYPVEHYVLCLQDGELASGVYHYRPDTHALETLKLLNEATHEQTIETMFLYPWARETPCFLVATSVWGRTMDRYLHIGYQNALIEAGYAYGGATLGAVALGVSSRPLAGFRFDLVCKLLDIDGRAEAPVHMLALAARTRPLDTP